MCIANIVLKNGSTIQVQESNENVRGHRSKVIEPFWGDEPYIESNIVKEVIEKFINKERIAELPSDSDIYLSSARRFKIGDRVKVAKILEDDFICGEPDSPYGDKDRCGTVIKAYDGVWNYDVEVSMDIDGQIICWLDGELELAHKNQSLYGGNESE